MEKRASIRAFKPARIPRDDLLRIIDAGRRAPSGYNYQGWQFVAVTDPATLQQLGQIQGCIGQASAAVAVVMEETRFWKEDASAAIENMLLAAVALGYGSLWVEGYVLRQEPLARQILGVPEDLRVIAVLPIGHPATEARQADKKPLEAVLHWNRFGQRGE
jgi:nitroreductase